MTQKTIALFQIIEKRGRPEASRPKGLIFIDKVDAFLPDHQVGYALMQLEKQLIHNTARGEVADCP